MRRIQPLVIAGIQNGSEREKWEKGVRPRESWHSATSCEAHERRCFYSCVKCENGTDGAKASESNILVRSVALRDHEYIERVVARFKNNPVIPYPETIGIMPGESLREL